MIATATRRATQLGQWLRAIVPIPIDDDRRITQRRQVGLRGIAKLATQGALPLAWCLGQQQIGIGRAFD